MKYVYLSRMKGKILWIIFFVVYVLGFAMNLSAQSKLDLEIDSLKRELPLNTGEEQITVLLNLGSKYSSRNIDTAIYYTQKGHELAMESDNDRQKAVSFHILGKIYSRKGDFVLAQDYYSQGLEIASKLEGDKQRELYAHINNSIGVIHAKQGEYDKALGYFLSALEVWEEKDKKKSVAALLSNIGLIHKRLGDYDQALESLYKAREISLSIGNTLHVATCMHNLGDVYTLKKEYKNALNAYQKSLQLKEVEGVDLKLLLTLRSMGELYIETKRYRHASEVLERGMAIAQKNDHNHYKQKIWASMGRLRVAQKDYITAINYYEKSLSLARELKLKKEMLELLNDLAATHKQINDYPPAYNYLMERQQLQDSLQNKTYQEKLAKLGAEFKLDQNKAEIKQLNAEKRANKLQIWSLSAFALFILCALAASLFFVINKRKANRLLIDFNEEIATQNKLLAEKQHEITHQNDLLAKQSEEIQSQNLQLKQSNADLRQFAYAASHDLREPLRTIRSYLQLLERRYKNQLDQDANDFIEFAVDGASRMDRLLQDLLSYSRIGRENMVKNVVDLNRILRKVEDSLHHQITLNEATISSPSLPYIEGYEHQIYLLFQNLISNAIKFRKEEAPSVEIDIRQENGHYLLMIKDNGIGIKEEHKERIFTLFQRLHPRSKYEGTGMGLAICKKIVSNHGGEIWVDSHFNKGSTFFVRIPAGNTDAH